MRLLAAIFDLNGTLVDDIAFHYRAWLMLAERHGFAMDEALFQSFNGQKNADIFPRLFGGKLDDAQIDALAREKESIYRELYRPQLAPLRGAVALLERLRARGVRLALASSAPAENRALVLDGLDWHRMFDVVVDSAELPGKPAPDIFLAAAAQLGCPPSQCIVFEDAENGVRAAKAGGFVCIGLATNVDPDRLRDAGATLTVAHFDALPQDLDAILRPMH